MKKWEILNELRIKNHELRIEDLVKNLLENRGIKTKKETDEFLNPSLESLTSDNLSIDKKELSRAIKRIKKAIEEKELIIIFGDYDCDGVSGTAILWETLNSLGAKVMPYIPDRIEEGYGLSKKGIENLKIKYEKASLIITVDNGIVANNPVEFANSLGIDVVITDHHVPGKKLPDAFAIVHSTKICGAAVAWFLSQCLLRGPASRFPPASAPRRLTRVRAVGSPSSPVTPRNYDHLGLVALATVTDMMQLTGFNRTLVKLGLEQIRKTKRPGLLSLFKLAEIDQSQIGVYELGHIIGPRINAMGRLEHAMDSLRLLCTTNLARAEDLAKKLNSTNLERQQLTIDSFLHAKELVGKSKKKLLFVSHEIYEPGVIGLIAGKLSEEFYRPSIVVSIREIYSKASARSVSGFNIIEFIRLSSSLLVDVGGHPGAAGFTIETKKISQLKKLLESLAEKNITEDLLIRKLKIDCELSLELINQELFEALNKLAPFGYGNPEPVFLARNVVIEEMRLVGKDGRHLKLKIKNNISNLVFDAILFGYDNNLNLKIGDVVDVVYTIFQNEWLARRPVRQSFSVGGSLGEGGNGNKKLELKIKDIERIS